MPEDTNRLVWDKADERNYHHSIDRGVLYPPVGPGVPWNGLSAVMNDDGQSDTVPLYFDGLKYLDDQNTKDFSGSISAYTYPDEFELFEGSVEIVPGIFVDGQQPETFGLSYRTKTATSYLVHLLYGLTAIPSEKAHTTISGSVNILAMTWNITGIPSEVTGFSPTEHFILDPEDMGPGMMGLLESILYGDEDREPSLPPINELIAMAADWDPRIIEPQSNGIALLPTGMGDLTSDEIDGFYRKIPGSRLKETSVNGIHTLE